MTSHPLASLIVGLTLRSLSISLAFAGLVLAAAAAL
jgi:hypothetical protein